MTEPLRLRDGVGPAGVLMGGSGLEVPSAARRRALAFTSAAVGMTAASGTAVAATATSLVKSVVLCVCLGTVGGGLMSLTVSETISRLETPQVDAKPAPAAKPAATGASAAAITPPTVAEEVVIPAAPARAVARDARDARASGPLPTAAGVGSPSAAAISSGKPHVGPSLFEEQRSIESARAAVARGDVASALSTLDGYERAYAQGQFGPEALALRIEALRSKGDLGRARSLAAEFRQRYPHHPLLSRVQAAVQQR